MAYNPNTAQLIAAHQDGIGILTNEADWFKRLLKTALCSASEMTTYSCEVVSREGDVVQLQTSTSSLFIVGQSIVISGSGVPEFDGSHVLVDSQLPNKFAIRIPEGSSVPSSPFSVRLRTGSWTFTDVSTHITDFYPRDYVAGEDYFFRLDTEPFSALTNATQGRACEFSVWLDIDGTLVQINTQRMVLATRFLASKTTSTNFQYTAIKPRHKQWSIFFDHESVYFISSMPQGLITSNNDFQSTATNFAYCMLSLPDDWIRPSSGSTNNNYAVNFHNYMGSLSGIDPYYTSHESTVAFCFARMQGSEWYGELSPLDSRVYAAPSFYTHTVKNTDYDSMTSALSHPAFPNMRASVLPLGSSFSTSYDTMTRLAKVPNSTTVDSRVSFSFGTAGTGGAYPYNNKQVVGKDYYYIGDARTPYGYLKGRVSLLSNIGQYLVSEPQAHDGGGVKYSIFSTPVERYEDDSTLIAVARGSGGGRSVVGSESSSSSSVPIMWDAFFIGGTWDVS